MSGRNSIVSKIAQIFVNREMQKKLLTLSKMRLIIELSVDTLQKYSNFNAY